MNKARNFSLLLASAAMLAAALLAESLKPRELMARTQQELDLEKSIPTAFGDWRPVSGIHVVEPQGSDTLSHEIYNQEIARGYLDPDDHFVMLLVAYGESQSERLQLHRPEICYAAQGFRVSGLYSAALDYSEHDRPIPLRRLVTQRDDRFEPVTYWMRIGYDISEGVLERQRLKLEYGLRGLVPDGALLRVSTLNLPEAESFRIQDKFIRDLINSVDATTRRFLVGVPSKSFIGG
jgi:EpsI family protein